MNHPLEEAAHLYKVAQDIEDRNEITQGQPSSAVLICLHPRLYGALLHEFARGLERGYRRGRAMAAYDVRMGLDEIQLNGSVHYDSDTEAPPEWLVQRAEKLARGNS